MRQTVPAIVDPWLGGVRAHSWPWPSAAGSQDLVTLSVALGLGRGNESETEEAPGREGRMWGRHPKPSTS